MAKVGMILAKQTLRITRQIPDLLGCMLAAVATIP